MNADYTDLESCPRCPEEFDSVIAVRRYIREDDSVTFWVECLRCHLVSDKYHEKCVAIEDWNDFADTLRWLREMSREVEESNEINP